MAGQAWGPRTARGYCESGLKTSGRDALINTAQLKLPGEVVAARDAVRSLERLVALAEQLGLRIAYHSTGLVRLSDDVVTLVGPPDAEPGQDEKSPVGCRVYVEVEAIVRRSRISRENGSRT